MTDVPRETSHDDSGRICGRCSARAAAPGQRWCQPCHTDYVRAQRAGMVNVLLTPDEWLAVKAARLAAIGADPTEGLGLHWRPRGQQLLACGAPHRPYRPAGSKLCCTTDQRKVTCKLCLSILTNTGPRQSAISPPPAPAVAGGGSGAAGGSFSTTRITRSVPGTGPASDAARAFIEMAPPESIYLRIGGRRPGLYVDGKKVV